MWERLTDSSIGHVVISFLVAVHCAEHQWTTPLDILKERQSLLSVYSACLFCALAEVLQWTICRTSINYTRCVETLCKPVITLIQVHCGYISLHDWIVEAAVLFVQTFVFLNYIEYKAAMTSTALPKWLPKNRPSGTSQGLWGVTLMRYGNTTQSRAMLVVEQTDVSPMRCNNAAMKTSQTKESITSKEEEKEIQTDIWKSQHNDIGSWTHSSWFGKAFSTFKAIFCSDQSCTRDETYEEANNRQFRSNQRDRTVTDWCRTSNESHDSEHYRGDNNGSVAKPESVPRSLPGHRQGHQQPSFTENVASSPFSSMTTTDSAISSTKSESTGYGSCQSEGGKGSKGHVQVSSPVHSAVENHAKLTYGQPSLATRGHGKLAANSDSVDWKLPDPQINVTSGIAVVYVVDIRGSKSLKAIVEQAFITSLPESQRCSAAQKTRFPIRACQVIGTVLDRSVSWSVTEPIADISHCSTLLGETQTPIFLVVPLEFLRNVGTGKDPHCLSTTLQNMRIDPQQSPLHVIIADEGESEDVDENDALRDLDAVMKKTLSSSYRLFYWKASQQQFSLQSNQSNIIDAMKETAIKHTESTAMAHQFVTLEEYIIFQRKQGVRVLFPEKLKAMVNKPTDDQSWLHEIRQLEKKGLVVRGGSTGSSDPSRTQTGKRNFTTENNSFPQFLILQPIWFYEKASSFIQAVLDRRTREDALLLPSARNNAFYSKEIIDDVADQVFSDTSPTDRRVFMEALHYHGVIITEREGRRFSGPNHQEVVFIPATLRNENLPPLEGQVVSPIALKSPGKRRTKIPPKLYYLLVSALAKRFRFAVLCTQTEARFNVQENHVLQLLYSEEYACIKVTMFVFTEDPTFTSTSTANVCADVKKLIAKHITALSRSCESVNLEFAAVIETDPEGLRPVDFVDLADVDVMSVHQLYSVGNHPFHPPNDFYLWFGKPGKVTRIREDFDQLSKQLNASVDIRKAAAWLFQTWRLAQVEMIDMLRTDPSERGSFLLLLLDKRGKIGDTLLETILYQPSLRKIQDPGHNVDNLAPSELLNAQNGRPTLSPPQDKHSSSSQTLILDEDVEPDSSELPRTSRRTSTTPPSSSLCESKHAIADGSPMSKRQVSSTDCSRHVTDEPDSAISSTNCDPSTRHEDNPGLLEEPPFHRDQVVVPSSTSFRDVERSSIAVPQQQTSTPAVAEALLRRTQIHSTKLQFEEPQIHPIFEAKYEHVQKATNNFDSRPVRDGGKRLGAGSFGTVYFGILHSESADTFEIAIKRLKKASNLKPDEVEVSRKQFGTEMHVLTRYIHPNIVKLVGFSSDGPDLCLLYEYMPQGALSNRLDCKDKTPPIQWHHRITIGRDIAAALQFLHTRYRQPVTHRDVKSSNVLLGHQMEAKLSDFGLAVVGESHSVRGPYVGTRPYMPPEAFKGVVSPKLDVYGFGMILYELATGLPPYSTKKKQDLKDYIMYIEGQNVDMHKMLDPKARWPKGRGSFGRTTFGLDLLDAAKVATTKDHVQRPDISYVLSRLQPLADKVTAR